MSGDLCLLSATGISHQEGTCGRARANSLNVTARLGVIEKQDADIANDLQLVLIPDDAVLCQLHAWHVLQSSVQWQLQDGWPESVLAGFC